MDEFADAQWERVARSIPGRSAGDCQWQSRKLAVASRQAWSSEEDQKLLTLAEQQTDVRPPWLERNRNLLHESLGYAALSSSRCTLGWNCCANLH